MGKGQRDRTADGGSTAARADRRLAWLPWLIILAALPPTFLLPGSAGTDIPDAVVVPVIGCLFLAMIARTAFRALTMRPVAAGLRNRQIALLAQATGLTLWAAGSTTLNASGTPNGQDFPAPGEIFYLLAYAGFATFIVMDARTATKGARGRLLEAVVTCGGAFCLAGLLMASPLGDGFGRQGVPLMIALLYPLLDLSLMTIVIGQLVLRVRRRSRRTGLLAAGILLVAVADLTLVRNLSHGTYDYGIGVSISWLLGFMLISEAACRPPDAPATRPRDRAGVTMVAPGFVAIFALAFQPAHGTAYLVVVPAIVTLVAAGARMLQALTDAHLATEAFRLSRTDDLTGLLNRRGLTRKVDARLAAGEPTGLVLVDLDGFKEINDSLGHEAGDTMLKLIADRLRQAFPREVTVGRLGGDEFLLALPQEDPEALMQQAHSLLDVLRRPATVDGVDLVVTASVGVTARDPEDRDFGDLLRRADVAMYQAKSERVGVTLYHPQRDTFSKARLSLADELRRAIEDGGLAVHYQPQLAAGSRSTVGVEALVRWPHPEHGMLPPGEFLPVARRAGLMGALSEFVMETMLQDLQRWDDQGRHIYASLNLAPPELLGGPVVRRLNALLDAAQLPSSRVVVEVTEDSLLGDPGRALEVIRELTERGVQVSIDDFGTGFSSLAYLRTLPVQELKIDREFVVSVLSDPRARMVVESVNHLAHGLGMHTVAEGVEDEPTAVALGAIGVDVLQGYLFARPMSEPDLQLWMARNTLSSGSSTTLSPSPSAIIR